MKSICLKSVSNGMRKFRKVYIFRPMPAKLLGISFLQRTENSLKEVA
jgi:hypothetical protein